MEVVNLNGDQARDDYSAQSGASSKSSSVDVENGSVDGNSPNNNGLPRYNGISQSSGLSEGTIDLSGRNLMERLESGLSIDLSGRNFVENAGDNADPNDQTKGGHHFVRQQAMNSNRMPPTRPHSSPHASLAMNPAVSFNGSSQSRPHSSPYISPYEDPMDSRNNSPRNKNTSPVRQRFPSRNNSPYASPVRQRSPPRNTSPYTSPVRQRSPPNSPNSSDNSASRSSQQSIQFSAHQNSPRHNAGEQIYISPSKSILSNSTEESYSPSPPFAKFRKKIRFSVENEVRTYVPNPEEFIDNPAIQVNFLIPTCASNLRQALATSALPFTYGATSSLTTLFFLYELLMRYEGRTEIIGLYLVGVYICRILFSSLSRYAPKTFVLIGSISALGGYMAIFISQTPKLMGFDEKIRFSDDGLALFIIGSIFANCNETVGAMQMFVKDQYSGNVKTMGSKLITHFLMAKVARIGSFLGGGLLYHYYGVHYVALLGAIMVSLQILFLTSFLMLDSFRIPHDPMNALGSEPTLRSQLCRLTCSIRAARGRRRMFKSSLSKLNRTLSKYYPSPLPPSTIRYLVPICIFGRTTSSIIIWISSPIIMVDDFEQDFIAVSVVFATAVGCDFLVSLFNLKRSPGDAPPPMSINHLFSYMAGISIGSILLAMPNFYAFAAGFMIYNISNSMLRFALIEIQGTSNNATEGVLIQILRRFKTAAALYCIPLLYTMHPRLPLILALWFSLLSSLVLIWVLACCKQTKETLKVDDDVEQKKQKTRSIKRRSAKPERNLTHAERIMLGRLITGKDV